MDDLLKYVKNKVDELSGALFCASSEGSEAEDGDRRGDAASLAPICGVNIGRILCSFCPRPGTPDRNRRVNEGGARAGRPWTEARPGHVIRQQPTGTEDDENAGGGESLASINSMKPTQRVRPQLRRRSLRAAASGSGQNSGTNATTFVCHQVSPVERDRDEALDEHHPEIVTIGNE